MGFITSNIFELIFRVSPMRNIFRNVSGSLSENSGNVLIRI